MYESARQISGCFQRLHIAIADPLDPSTTPFSDGRSGSKTGIIMSMHLFYAASSAPSSSTPATECASYVRTNTEALFFGNVRQSRIYRLSRAVDGRPCGDPNFMENQVCKNMA